MTGEEFFRCNDGDYLKLTEDKEMPNGYHWSKNDVLQIEYREITGGKIDSWVRNLTWQQSGKQPSALLLGAYWFLNYMELVNDNMNKTTVKHKLKAGDAAYIMANNTPHRCTIDYVDVKITKDNIITRYHVYGNDTATFYGGDKIFATKDELLDSLR